MLDELAGHVLDGKYRVERKLGQGGMGAVYLATHVGTTRPVAVKLIVPRFVANEEFLERFRREASAAGRLRHPNVVNVTDFGFTGVDGSRFAYLVMEYLDGESLRELLGRDPTPPVDFVVDVVEQCALAIDEAHRNGIVHRDLKPDNVWLQPNGRGGFNVKVLDFGLAKLHGPGEGAESADGVEPRRAQAYLDTPATLVATAVWTAAEPPVDAGDTLHYGSAQTASDDLAGATAPGEESSGELTQAGSVLGTPAYMSPEQCVGRAADSRSDVYSLAVMTYEMLAGRLPFKGDSLALLAQHAGAPPPPLTDLSPSATPAIAELVARGLAKDPADRPATATAFAGALRARTITGSQVLRRAVAVYSEQFPAVLRLSLFANVPMFVVGAALLLVMAFVRVGVWQAAVCFGVMLLAVNYPFATNRATFALLLDALRERPLDRVDAGDVLERLATRLGGEGKGRLWLGLRLMPFATRSAGLKYSWSVPAEIVEGLDRRGANERSLRLSANVAVALRSAALFGLVCYAVPTILFFLSALGLFQAFGSDLSTATSASFAVAIVVMGMNVVWLIPPAHLALVMLYFVAREASGEA